MSLKKPVSAVRFAVKSLGFAAVGVLCLPVAAQQAIHFSKPTDQGPAVTASTFERSVNHTAPSAFNAPTPLFGSANNSVLTPGTPPPIYPNPNAALWQKALQDRKNWTLMTPEQILGIQTPESILGVADQQEDAKLSPEERFLKRRDQEEQAGATNGALRSISSYRSSSIWGDLDTPGGAFQDSGSKNGLPGQNNRQMNSQMSENRGALFNQDSALSALAADAAPAAHSIWASSFQSSSPTPKPTPQQLVGMKQFRALLDSSPAQAGASPNSYSDSAAAAPATAATADPFRQTQSASSFNPRGSAPFALESGISKPTGITPLPGITGVHPPAPKPPPLVQPPPWMSQTPQVGVLQQRTF